MSAYNRLNQIWSGEMASNVLSSKSGSYTVPKLCPQGDGPHYPPKYNTLHHGLDESKRHGGYFNLTHAYPYADCESCKVTTVERPCLGQIPCNGAAAPAPVAGGNGAAPAPVAGGNGAVEQQPLPGSVVESYFKSLGATSGHAGARMRNFGNSSKQSIRK